MLAIKSKPRKPEAGPSTPSNSSQERPPLKRRRVEETASAPSSSSRPNRTPAEPREKVVWVKDRPRDYGYWQATPGDTKGKPRALIIFSGRSRSGDLSHQLARLGWLVCSLDTQSPVPTDILDDAIWDDVSSNIRDGYFDALWLGTPCGTFSPLREKPPGPRPLRSKEHIEGLPQDQLTEGEIKQLKTANVLVKRTYTAAAYQNRAKKPWGVENPKHPDDKPQLWQMPLMQALAKLRNVEAVDFDQCRTGLGTTKPTRMLVKRIKLDSLRGLRCNHVMKQHTRPDGSTYTAAHESTVQRWIEGPTGRQRASKAQGEYSVTLCKILAKAFHEARQEALGTESPEKEEAPTGPR